MEVFHFDNSLELVGYLIELNSFVVALIISSIVEIVFLGSSRNSCFAFQAVVVRTVVLTVRH